MFSTETNVRANEIKCPHLGGIPCLGRRCNNWAWITVLPEEDIGFCGLNRGAVAALPKFLLQFRKDYVVKPKKPLAPRPKHTGILAQRKVNPEKLEKALEEAKKEEV